MMLIYTNQNGLEAEKYHRSAMGLAADTKPVVKGKGDASCKDSTSNEDMKRNEEDDSSATTIELLHWLQMWNYDDFDFEKIGEGFFGTVYKVRFVDFYCMHMRFMFITFERKWNSSINAAKKNFDAGKNYSLF